MAVSALDNWEKFNYLGIIKFHNKGYKGQGIIIASREGTKSKHGNMVADVIQQICPAATFLENIEYKNPKEMREDIDIYTTSLFFSSDRYEKNIQEAINVSQRGTLLCCAVGNGAKASQTHLSKQAHWISIGACDFIKGKLVRMNYSSITKDLDFATFTNLKTNKGKFDGTSCASPCFAAMVALLQGFVKEKIGRKLTYKELMDFIKEHCEDLDKEGFDENTGFGMFILPDPDEIDLSKYLSNDSIINVPIEEKEPFIKMTIGSKEIYVNGEKQIIDLAPFIKDNKACIPIRFLAETLGYKVEWNNDKKEIKITDEK